jgi:hypothetical protein
MNATERTYVFLLSNGFIIVPLAYFLSVGPAMFLAQKGVITTDTFYFFYWPLYRPKASDFYKDLFNWYTRFWLNI